jgi:hypothetical protein
MKWRSEEWHIGIKITKWLDGGERVLYSRYLAEHMAIDAVQILLCLTNELNDLALSEDLSNNSELLKQYVHGMASCVPRDSLWLLL